MFLLAYLFSGPPSSSKTPETFYRSDDNFKYSKHTATNAFQISIIKNSHNKWNYQIHVLQAKQL